jgi:hypothetical protein
MRAHEFINEAEDAALRKELQKDWMPQGYIPSKENRGKNLTLPRDERGWPIEPGLEAPLISPEDILLPFAGLGKKVVQGATGLARNIGTRTAADAAAKSTTVAPELAKDTVGKIKDIGYDLANKPHPYNPLTAKNIGREQGTARYHADKAFRKEYGMEPPSYSNIDKEIQQFGGTGPYKQASKKYTDMSNDFLNRGYQIRPPTVPEIGTNVGAQVPTKIEKGSRNIADILDPLAVKSLKTGMLDPVIRSGALSAARSASDWAEDIERRKNEYLNNKFKEFLQIDKIEKRQKNNASK